MKVLCVAEKPSVAKAIAPILARPDRPQQRPGQSRYCANWDFTADFRGQQCQMTMTSVAGHLMSLDFASQFRSWQSCPPGQLFHAEVSRQVPENMEDLAKNLEKEAKYCRHLLIWTDNDREGEYIGAEIASVCRRSNPSIQVWRCRFSVIQPREIQQALRDASNLDQRQVDAVEARSELDLRIGAVFTRFQTVKMQRLFPLMQQTVVSYGTCQFPTLGFVVEQYLKRENFIVEHFWSIVVGVKRENLSVTFNWQRQRLFDRHACLILYEMCLDNPEATIVSVKKSPMTRYRPVPLNTVELQKMGSIYLKLSSHTTMEIAERLYNKGLLSYPRTETDSFESGFDLKGIIQHQTGNEVWGQFANNLLNNDGFEWPRRGNNSDNAHTPIYPTKAAPADLSGNDKRLYELVTRRFLACCSKSAKGSQTTITLKLHTEIFTAHGSQLEEKNFLEVYVYQKWADQMLPNFRENERFVPDSCEMTSSQTSPPTLITEPMLISTMDKNGIGTDATIAEHIKKIIDRQYVFKEREYFVPSTLGLALVEGYDKIGLEQSLAQPNIRRNMEAGMMRICRGQEDKNTFINNIRGMYERMFEAINARQDVLIASWNRFLSQSDDDDNNDNEQILPHMARDSGDDDDENDGNNTNNHRRRPRREEEPKPKCQCDLIAVKKRVSKDGPNKGRSFWTCTKTSGTCRFFQWDEDDNQQEVQTGRSDNSRSRGRSSSSRGKPRSKRGRGRGGRKKQS